MMSPTLPPTMRESIGSRSGSWKILHSGQASRFAEGQTGEQ